MEKHHPWGRTYHLLFVLGHSPVFKTNKFVLRHRLLIFLMFQLSLLLLLPIIQEQYPAFIILPEILLSTLLIVGIYIVSDNRQLLTTAVLVAVLTLIVMWFNFLLKDKNLLTFSLALEIVFFILATGAILYNVFQHKRMTADKIYGAICAYLLLGIVWALIYSILEHILPGTFHFDFPHAETHPYSLQPQYFSQFMYFSFTTLTTLGYGDIVPLTHIGSAFSSLEAVTGQLYVAVLIARLVGLHIVSSHLRK